MAHRCPSSTKKIAKKSWLAKDAKIHGGGAKYGKFTKNFIFIFYDSVTTFFSMRSPSEEGAKGL